MSHYILDSCKMTVAFVCNRTRSYICPISTLLAPICLAIQKNILFMPSLTASSSPNLRTSIGNISDNSSLTVQVSNQTIKAIEATLK